MENMNGIFTLLHSAVVLLKSLTNEMPLSIQATGGDHISAFIEMPLKFLLKMQNLTSLTAIDFSIQTHYKLLKVVIKAQVDEVFVVLGVDLAPKVVINSQALCGS